MKQFGTLYIVATPIGNMQDISLRAMQTLFRVDCIACEDTRRAGLFLKRLEEFSRLHLPSAKADGGQANNPMKRPRLISYYEQNEQQRIPKVVTALKSGLNVALISDAGTPLISDPGFKLVRTCLENGIKVEVIPGPSSVITALTVSGLPTDKFLFLGYLSKKPGQKQKVFLELLQSFKTLKRAQPTIIFFESPYRLVKTLEVMQEVFGDIDVVVARELTKMHEELRRENIKSMVSHFKTVDPKGEIVVLFSLKEKTT